jgi:hypothetical protein
MNSFPLPFATHDDARIDDGFDETRSRRTPDVGGSISGASTTTRRLEVG